MLTRLPLLRQVVFAWSQDLDNEAQNQDKDNFEDSIYRADPHAESHYAARDKWNRGCLIGDFSIETTAQSKLLQQRLEAIFEEWRAPFASCISEAQASGEIDTTFDPNDLAEFLLASWEGAILRMKVDRGPAALERFRRIVFETVFKELK